MPLLQKLVTPEEQGVLKMLWLPQDEWEKYLITHMHAIRAKYFPKAPKA